MTNIHPSKNVYPEQSRRVFVGMSGGVDSSVTALLLRDQGYDVVGVFMKCFNVDGCAEQDAEDARRVAGQLGIPFYVWDFEDAYKKRVVEYMIEGYRNGITPNPDVMCNREIKFGLFLEKALLMGADYVATGHYVRLRRTQLTTDKKQLTNESDARQMSDVNCQLFSALDTNKDQSYFLWTLTQAQLRHCLFPIGDYTKPEVRAIAQRAGLVTAEKKDSQGICFLGQVTLDDFLAQYIPEKHGEVVHTSGKTLGTHKGAYFYTIGQRHGFSDALRSAGSYEHTKGGRKPLYISNKDVRTNTLTVVEGSDHPELFKQEVELTQTNFISPINNIPLSVKARVRYRQPLADATLLPLETGNWKLVFSEPQKFVAPGQSAVFYSREGEMIGGGVIIS